MRDWPPAFPDVDANVVPVGPMLVLDKSLYLIQEAKNSGLLLGCHVEEACNMALWDDEYVSTAQRVVVVTRVREFVLHHGFNGNTQLAGRWFGCDVHRLTVPNAILSGALQRVRELKIRLTLSSLKLGLSERTDRDVIPVRISE